MSLLLTIILSPGVVQSVHTSRRNEPGVHYTAVKWTFTTFVPGQRQVKEGMPTIEYVYFSVAEVLSVDGMGNMECVLTLVYFLNIILINIIHKNMIKMYLFIIYKFSPHIVSAEEFISREYHQQKMTELIELGYKVNKKIAVLNEN